MPNDRFRISREWGTALLLAGGFLAIWAMPLESLRFRSGLDEALALTR